MATNKTKQTLVEKTANNVLCLATKANDFALGTTEKVFDTSFKVAEKSLNITSTVIKKGLDITATQQDLVFDVLNGIKKKISKD
ncbi:hypothetical protein L0P88_04255 [Muricauda sp. SCSIO 64092]|uniref:hypothetical protein n=1 Tax=Allomuricauda sp. SCSIO 64092 TaxID=2908842 RepID=UPI00131B97CD|nr:hypothetical protein [Muricauda sp. SCSIO 64092]UOY07767.1 hypothetical protein L0P88_04255 [Muricauda sp. SCSIO 64092]